MRFLIILKNLCSIILAGQVCFGNCISEPFNNFPCIEEFKISNELLINDRIKLFSGISKKRIQSRKYHVLDFL